MHLPGHACRCGARELIAIAPGQAAIAAVHDMTGALLLPAVLETPGECFCLRCWPVMKKEEARDEIQG